MLKRGKYIGLVVLVMLGFCQLSSAQLNLKIGYTATYAPLTNTNNTFSAFTASQAEVESKFRSFHIFHGLELGLRYMLSDRWAVEGSWVSGQTRNNGIVYKDATGKSISDEWRINSSRYALNLEYYTDYFVLGTGLGKRTVKYLTDITGFSKKQTIQQFDYQVSQFYVMFHTITGRTAIGIKPFVEIPWADGDISKVNTELGVSTTSNTEKMTMFGLSIVFYNGKQRH